MLQIKDVVKQYRTGDLVQTALNHVSLNLRDNEFVAILGPSGSGKTTLLNVIGGLDRYDSGDLVINGISTRKYKDRDWDAYRNHTIGFVFQSYNLIPHQSVLSNVELALTISGISGKERKQRAIDALDKVGLKDQMHKYPNQMSGGQMQRVAIARALVNNPDILLADEPTGALDSETSVQVMDLLKAVAKDRLVVMVTHNPQLAEAYATRIVRLKDGKIISDTDPFVPEVDIQAEHKPMKRTGMSFLTALALSFNNLRTKLARTLLVSFAGSIGIIGIASIQSLSNGVNGYISDVEQQTLSTYPVEIDRTSFSLSDMADEQQEQVASAMSEDRADTVKERRMITALFANTSENDLASFKDWIESDQSDLKNYAKDIEYSYGITPLIYRQDGNEIHRVNPSSTMSALGMDTNSMFMSTSVFYALPDDAGLYKDEYEVKAGRLPQKWNECVVVLQTPGVISDLMLYTLGLKDPDELDDMLEKFSNNESVKVKDDDRSWKYSELINGTFRVINSADCYRWDEDYGIWTDRSDDDAYMEELVRNGEELKVTGVIVPKKGTEMASLNPGIGYLRSLDEHLIQEAGLRKPVQDQLDHPEKDIFTGRNFDDTSDPAEALDLSNLFTFDENAFRNAFSVDTSKLQVNPDDFDFQNMDFSDMDISGLIDPAALQNAMPSLTEDEISRIIGSVKFKSGADQKLIDLFRKILMEYTSSEDGKQAISSVQSGIQQYLQDENGMIKDLTPVINQIFDEKNQENQIGNILTGFATELMKRVNEYAMNQPVDPQPAEPAETDAPDDGGETAPEPDQPTPAPSQDPSQMAQLIQEYLATEEGQAFLKGYEDQLAELLRPGDTDIQRIATAVAEGYQAYTADPTNNAAGVDVILKSFSSYMQDQKIQDEVMDTAKSVIDTSGVPAAANELITNMTTAFATELNSQISNGMTAVMGQIGTKLQTAMNNAVQSLAANLPSAFHIDPEVMANALKMNMDGPELQSLLKSLLSTDRSSLQSNLSRLGYADAAEPMSILIYPKGFNSKADIVNCISDYNNQMEKKGMDDKVIHYSDITASIMGSITKIVNVIGYVLLAVTAISLIVSSIMIGIITYISVLERKKEIGILRAMGASKRNVANVFNAETFITGLLAGLMGIGLTELLLIPANKVIRQVAQTEQITAYLPLKTMLELVGLSIVLTLISGLIPSGKASHEDPVRALRTE